MNPLAECAAGARASQCTACYFSVVDSVRSGVQQAEVDWSGVRPDETPIEPLTAETFVARLESLTEAVAALAALKRAFDEQHRRTRP